MTTIPEAGLGSDSGSGSVSMSRSGMEAYVEDVKRVNAVPLWTLADATQAEPRPMEVPWVWKWNDLFPLLRQAAEVVDVGAQEAERRVLTLKNPGRPYVGATHSLTASLQMVLPGEVAPAHRHTMCALRFIIQGQGGYTVVDGEKLPMSPGDLILTPGWTWHDHHNEGQEPVVWFDGLDYPFVNSTRAIFYEDYAEETGESSQPVTTSPARSHARYGGGGGVIAANQRATTSLHSPLLLYPFAQAHATLRALQADDEVDLQEGALLEYVNPTNGGHAMPTIACFLQGLPAGFEGKAYRTTASSVFLVVRGSGASVINHQRLDWQQNDIVAIPAWAWQEHAASPGEDVVLFRVSDLPTLEPFGLVREQRYRDNGGHQHIRAA